MKILAVETSTKNLGIVIADERSVIAEYTGISELRHSQELIPSIDTLLKETGITLYDIDCFAVSIGPGSFTGLRVGVAAIKGLNLVTGKPIVTIPTLDVIGYNAIGFHNLICVIVDAKKNNLYGCLYKVEDKDIVRASDYLLIKVDELIELVKEELKDKKGVLFLGDGIELYGHLILKNIRNAKLLDKKYWHPDAKIVAFLGRELFKRRDFQDPDTLVPMYMYSRECNIKGVER